MKCVVDTSIIIAVITNEEHKQSIISATKDVDLIAPGSLHWEIGNALSAMLKRNRITYSQCLSALKAYSYIPIQEKDIALADVLGLAGQFKIYAYDAYMLACSQKYHASMLSLDKGLISVAQQLGLPILEV